MNRMTKSIYLAGWLCFVGSFFWPATADQMTGQFGENVKVWCSPGGTHLKLALEPVAQVWECIFCEVPPDAHGDSREDCQRAYLGQALYFLPASCGWFSIWLSVVLMPWFWIRPIVNGRVRRFLWIAGVVMLVAVPLLAREYYHWATVYKGYFHLGLGAYLVVLAYVCIGSSLLRQFAGKQQAEPRTPEPGTG